MGVNDRSGHGNPQFWGQYSRINIKIVMVCALDENGRVTEYWWDVTPSGAQLKRSGDADETTKGRIFWELYAFDLRTGDQLNSMIHSLTMNHGWGWQKEWGEPREDPRHSDHRHWRMDVDVPGGEDLERFAYTVRVDVAGTHIKIDPEVDFEPGES